LILKFLLNVVFISLVYKAFILDLADKDKIPCYLDTANERSLKFFKKNGFEIHDDVVSPAYGPRFWTMVRNPAK
jgi:hypothetical protein